MLESLTTLLLILAGLTGVYVHISETWTLPYRLNLILHPLAGLGMTVVLVPYAIRHIREKGIGFHRVFRIGGWLALAGFAAVFLTALPLLPGAAHELDRIYLHRYVGYAVAALLVVHLTPRMVRDLRGLSWKGGRLSVLRSSKAGVTVAALAVLSLGAVAALPPKRESNTVEFHAMLSAPPSRRISSTALSMTSSCGSAAACHEGLTKEYEHSAHPLAPETPHFRKITGLLSEERGKGATRFCTSCHAPAVALGPDGKRPSENGFGCLVCHAQAESHLVPFDAAGYAREREGYTVTLNQDHLSMFPPDGERRLTRFNEYLIKLNPIGHGRVFRPSGIDQDALCLACHQEHIPQHAESQFLQPRCIDCHMKLQENLSETGSDRPHLFLGANVVLPRLRGDAEMERKVTAWMTGSFKTDVLDSFWELRSEKYEQPSKAVWLVMTLEPMRAARAGEMLPLKIYTSNVGIGHPFPTGVIDLYDIRLEVVSRAEDGRIVHSEGRVGGIYYKDDGVHRLGGFFTDEENNPIERHRIWTKKGATRRWIEVGRTTEDVLDIPVPKGAGDFLTVTARWVYERLNAPFVSWAFGPTPPDLPAVEMASVTQKIAMER